MIAAQIVGGIAFFCGVFAFLQKQDLKFRCGMMFFCFIMAIHFTMMGATVAAIGATINGIRVLVSIKTRTRWVMWLFILLLIGMTAPKISTPIEALTVIGSVIGTWALFSLKGIKMRCVILFNSCCWFTHNVWLGSIGGSLVEGAFIITNLVTIYQMYVMIAPPKVN